MDAVKADRWPHTTSDEYQDKDNVVGVALFDMEIEGEIQTAVYYQYKDGTRWPCRTICNTEQGRITLMHWINQNGVAHDERADKWQHPLPLERTRVGYRAYVEGHKITVERFFNGDDPFWRLALQPSSQHICLTPDWLADLPQEAVERYVATLKEKGLWPV